MGSKSKQSSTHQSIRKTVSPSKGIEKACNSYVLQDVSAGYFPANFYGFLITAAVLACHCNILLKALDMVAVETKRDFKRTQTFC